MTINALFTRSTMGMQSSLAHVYANAAALALAILAVDLSQAATSESYQIRM